MLSLLELTENDVLYDLGCGEGKILIEAVLAYKCKAVGIEVNPVLAKKAAREVKRLGLQNRINIVQGDVNDYTFENATAVTMHLYPQLIAKLVPKLRTKKVASYSHDIPGLETSRDLSGGYPIFVYTPRPTLMISQWPGWFLVN